MLEDFPNGLLPCKAGPNGPFHPFTIDAMTPKLQRQFANDNMRDAEKLPQGSVQWEDCYWAKSFVLNYGWGRRIAVMASRTREFDERKDREDHMKLLFEVLCRPSFQEEAIKRYPMLAKRQLNELVGANNVFVGGKPDADSPPKRKRKKKKKGSATASGATETTTGTSARQTNATEISREVSQTARQSQTNSTTSSRQTSSIASVALPDGTVRTEEKREILTETVAIKNELELEQKVVEKVRYECEMELKDFTTMVNSPLEQRLALVHPMIKDIFVEVDNVTNKVLRYLETYRSALPMHKRADNTLDLPGFFPASELGSERMTAVISRIWQTKTAEEKQRLQTADGPLSNLGHDAMNFKLAIFRNMTWAEFHQINLPKNATMGKDDYILLQMYKLAAMNEAGARPELKAEHIAPHYPVFGGFARMNFARSDAEMVHIAYEFDFSSLGPKTYQKQVSMTPDEYEERNQVEHRAAYDKMAVDMKAKGIEPPAYAALPLMRSGLEQNADENAAAIQKMIDAKEKELARYKDNLVDLEGIKEAMLANFDGNQQTWLQKLADIEATQELIKSTQSQINRWKIDQQDEYNDIRVTLESRPKTILRDETVTEVMAPFYHTIPMQYLFAKGNEETTVFDYPLLTLEPNETATRLVKAFVKDYSKRVFEERIEMERYKTQRMLETKKKHAASKQASDRSKTAMQSMLPSRHIVEHDILHSLAADMVD